MDIYSKVAVVLDQSAFYNYGAFPVVLHKNTIVHIVRYFAIRDLDWHRELFQEENGVL